MWGRVVCLVVWSCLVYVSGILILSKFPNQPVQILSRTSILGKLAVFVPEPSLFGLSACCFFSVCKNASLELLAFNMESKVRAAPQSHTVC